MKYLIQYKILIYFEKHYTLKNTVLKQKINQNQVWGLSVIANTSENPKGFLIANNKKKLIKKESMCLFINYKNIREILNRKQFIIKNFINELFPSLNCHKFNNEDEFLSFFFLFSS